MTDPGSADLHPLPHETFDAAPYWEGCRAGRLLIQYCRACASHQFYPRESCTACGSVHLDFVEASGLATVYAYSVCHKPLSPRFTDQTPYVVALVDVVEGPRMMTNIVGCPVSDLAIGTAVQVSFQSLGPDVVLPVFELAQSANGASQANNR
jgi:uncharacterized OB-fold protein